MSPFSLHATHHLHLHVGGPPEVRATVSVRATDIGAGGVEASLRLWTPHGATVEVFGEWAPAIRDLRHRALRLDDRTIACAAGRWSDGEREYELVIVVPPGEDGDEILAARLMVVVDDEVVGQAPIVVTWTADQSLAADAGATVRASVVADLPTGRSPVPRHVAGVSDGAAPCCAACGLLGVAGDRFCEGCGAPLEAVQKS